MAVKDNAAPGSADDSSAQPRATVGPGTSVLKAKFKSQSIPLEQDFADLIDIADVGRRAVGANPDQDGAVGAGLQADSTGKLAIKVTDPFKVDAQSGLTLGLGWSLELNEETPAVLEVKQGLGLVRTNAEGLSIKLAPNSGLTLGSDGLSVAGTVFQKGMIMMFSGAAIPEGWALCDGTNGTPNLVDRFVLGGTPADSGTASNVNFTGSGAEKNYSAKSDEVKPLVVVSVVDTVLDASQLPPHSHDLGRYTILKDIDTTTVPRWMVSGRFVSDEATVGNALWGMTEWDEMGSPLPEIPVVMAEAGGGGEGKPHSHQANAQQLVHDHTVSITPPYYILAFMMKL